MKNCESIVFREIGNPDRGFLIAIEGNKSIPFQIKRVYYMYDVPIGSERGFHAHKELEQILICIHGSVKIKCTDGETWDTFTLDSPNQGVYVGPFVWHEMYEYSKGTVLMVLASDYFDESDYLRNYDEFLSYIEDVNNGSDTLKEVALDSYEEIKNNKKDESEKNVFIHEKAMVDTEKVGTRTRIWGFVHILEGAVIGENCNICEHVFIENDVTLGNNVTVKCGVYIWDGVYIEDDVFIGPCVTFINDRHPRSKKYPEKFAETRICRGSSLGANSTIMGGINVGKHATIGAGSVVLKDVKPYEIVVGNPAKMIGYNCECGIKLKEKNHLYECGCGKTYQYINGELQMIV